MIPKTFLSFPVALKFLENLDRVFMRGFETVFSDSCQGSLNELPGRFNVPTYTRQRKTERCRKHPRLERGSNT